MNPKKRPRILRRMQKMHEVAFLPGGIINSVHLFPFTYEVCHFLLPGCVSSPRSREPPRVPDHLEMLFVVDARDMSRWLFDCLARKAKAHKKKIGKHIVPLSALSLLNIENGVFQDGYRIILLHGALVRPNLTD